MKIINNLIILIVISSCSKSFIGTYNLPNKTINLYEDSTYLYEYRIVNLMESSVGQWKLLGNKKLLLQSKPYQNLNLYRTNNGIFQAILCDGDTLINNFNIYLITDSSTMLLELNNGVGKIENLKLPSYISFIIEPRFDYPFKNDKLFSERIYVSRQEELSLTLNFDWWMFYAVDYQLDTVKIANNKLFWERVSEKKFRRIKRN